MEVTHIHHDRLCPVCATHSSPGCDCDCLCDFIADVREDERRVLGPYLRAGSEVAAENRP